ncbi:MAG: endopeptidase La [Alphaproteobacteria bacterium]|nr:endopeptidase La [Alphaproteobacteria bacterium]
MENKKVSDSDIKVVPLLPLRDVVVYPSIVIPLFVGRDKSVRALDAVMSEGKQILLTTQKEAANDAPKQEDLFSVGILAQVLQLLKLPDGTVKILVEGMTKVKLQKVFEEEGYDKAEVIELKEEPLNLEKAKPLFKSLLNQFEFYVKLNRRLPPEIIASIMQIQDIVKATDTIATQIALKVDQKQKLFETTSFMKRLELLYSYLEAEIDVLQVEKKIRNRVKTQMEKSQRDYYLNEQMKAIQKELGEGEEGSELDKLEAKIKAKKMSKEAEERALSELKKLSMMPSMSAEATVIRGYLDWLIALPWRKKSKLQTDLKKAEKILNQDHYGLEKVKERIIECLAVQKKAPSSKSPIICLVGPPGVGKTSLGQSIARATGRKFVRASLGGMRDEAEIRGHRRTYIGALPGKIIQSMKKVKTQNPLFLLDEIDKLSQDWRGNPASALLEVLDPEQNNTFNDNYLEVDYDLSNVMFVTTANTFQMPRPLLDRMEVIQLSGYTENEKVEIAKRHLIPKQMKEAGVKKNEFSLSPQALKLLIQKYTREAGVRNLEREIANLIRKSVKELLLEKKKTVAITEENLSKYAGVPRYSFGVAEKNDQIGVTTGLAWTEVGGEILSIEAVTMKGKGKTTITGQLGDVMKESIEAAKSFIRSRSEKFGIDPSVFEQLDIHVHVPEGATPKDGPSAGVTMCTSLVSALTGISVRKDIAMTGEITLRGRVLPIGGLKEKLLAALRGGLKTVLIPSENVKDLEEIPEIVKKKLKIIPVSSAEEVLDLALTQKVKTLK